jgi:hypothetical protein
MCCCKSVMRCGHKRGSMQMPASMKPWTLSRWMERSRGQETSTHAHGQATMICMSFLGLYVLNGVLHFLTNVMHLARSGVFLPRAYFLVFYTCQYSTGTA